MLIIAHRILKVMKSNCWIKDDIMSILVCALPYSTLMFFCSPHTVLRIVRTLKTQSRVGPFLTILHESFPVRKWPRFICNGRYVCVYKVPAFWGGLYRNEARVEIQRKTRRCKVSKWIEFTPVLYFCFSSDKVANRNNFSRLCFVAKRSSERCTNLNSWIWKSHSGLLRCLDSRDFFKSSTSCNVCFLQARRFLNSRRNCRLAGAGFSNYGCFLSRLKISHSGIVLLGES